MGKNLIKGVINDEDLHHASLNFMIAYVLGNVANVVANGPFDFDLNKYHTVKHFAAGVGLGTLAYRKARKKGASTGKSLLIALGAGTLFNAAWEGFECIGNVYDIRELPIDTITDIVAVYAGAIASFVTENVKERRAKHNKI